MTRLTERLELHPRWYSHELGLAQDVVVWRPAGSHSGKDPLPILIIHDGHSAFDTDPRGAEGVRLGVECVVERLAAAGLTPEMLLVAVDCRHASRDQILSPAVGGEAYARFLIHELLPFVRRSYPETGRTSFCASLGWSLGGAMSLSLAQAHPEVFQGSIAFSPCPMDCPSVDERMDRLDTWERWMTAAWPSCRLYLDQGTLEREGLPPHPLGVEEHPRVYQIAAHLAGLPQVGLTYRTIPEGRHRMEDWRSRTESALLSLWG